MVLCTAHIKSSNTYVLQSLLSSSTFHYVVLKALVMIKGTLVHSTLIVEFYDIVGIFVLC